MECLSRLRVFLIISIGLGPFRATTKCVYPEDIFGVQLEGWNNISPNSDFASNDPSTKTFIPSFEVPENRNLRNAGQRLRTYFYAPQTGNYIFYLACDDSCKLRLSADERLESSVTLISVHRYTRFREWKSTFSRERRLSKGHYYLLEASLTQFGGAYHISVGVKFPDGNYSRPIAKEFLVKHVAPGTYGDAPMGDWGEWSKCSRSCGLGTQSRSRSPCSDLPPVYKPRNATEMRVCQPMRPCSVPLSSIDVHNTSSTSLFVKWKSEWQVRWPNELLPFKITYNKTGDKTVHTITANATFESLEIRGLEAFRWYCVRVQLVTLEGIGRESPCVFAMTDQDVPCSSPSDLLAHSQSSPSKIRVKWRTISEPCWRGTPRGFSVFIKVNETVHVGNNSWNGHYKVGPLSTGFMLEGLQTHTRYSLQVAALTDKGPGPYSKDVQIETCRCPNKFFVHWVQSPPLITSFNDSVIGNGTTPAGLLPQLLADMITHACGVCHARERTVVIFREEKPDVQNITSSLNEHTQLNLPISMAPNVPFVREGWVFLPVMEVAGIAVLMRKPNTGMYAGKLGSSILLLWPIFVLMFALYCAVGLAMWSVETYSNPDKFSPRFTQGWSQGVWWAIVSMATVGYGDHYPISVPGRLLAIGSILVGIIINTMFMAAITSSLTVSTSDEAANPERGSKIGVVSGNVEHSLGMRINGSKGVSCILFSTKDSLLKELKSGTLDGALVDVLTVDPFIMALNDSNFEVAKIIPHKFYFGIILTGDAKYLVKYFEEYLKSVSIESLSKQPLGPAIQEKSPPRVTKPTQSAQEDVIPFFDPGNALFQRTVKVSGAGLLVFMICGLLFHFTKARFKNRQDEPTDPTQNLTALKAEMREILDDFYNRIRQRYCALKIKHRKQLLQLKKSGSP